jgi:hypothetical protein
MSLLKLDSGIDIWVEADVVDLRVAMASLKPTADYMTGAAADSLTWNDSEQTTPTQAEIDAEITRLQAAYDAQNYARSRQAEYPTIEECVHAILDDDLTALQVKRQAVKDKYPK